MTRWKVYTAFIAFGLMVVGCASVQPGLDDANLKPEMSITRPAKLDNKGNLEITGKGFTAGDAVTLLFTIEDGVQSDIGYALEPLPVPDNNGNWTTRWSYGRYVKKKLVKEGGYTLTAVDRDFNVLCSTNVEFVR